MSLLEKFQDIDTFIFDVDGVLTNGNLLVQNDGSLLRTMNIKDGYALQLAIKKGYQIFIISGGKNIGVQNRLEALNIKNIYLGIKDKVQILNDIVLDFHIHLDKCLYMGDDMPDLEAMQKVGFPCCPADACHEVIAKANYVSTLKGGEGCVREVIEKVMVLQGKWE